MDSPVNINELETYLDLLIEKKGIKPVGPNSIAIIKEDLREQLLSLINVGIVNTIAEDKLDEFTKLSEEGNQEKIAVFLSENIPTLADLIKQILKEFADVYLSN